MAKSYKIDFTPQAKAELFSLPIEINRRIVKKFYFFAAQENPLLFATKLVGTENTYRFRIGYYRAVFRVKPDGNLVILLMTKIGHRKNIYEN